MSRKQKYTQGILDGVQLIESYAAEISSKVPKENQYDALVQAITYVHIETLTQHNQAVSDELGVNWMPEEFLKNLKKKTEKTAKEA